VIRAAAISLALLAADLNGDQIVDGADLSRLLTAWTTGDLGADLNSDGTTDGRDLSTMLISYGRAWGRADTGDGGLWITEPGERATWGQSPFADHWRLTATRADGRTQSIDEAIQ